MTPNYQLAGSLPFQSGGNPLQGYASGGLQGLAQQYGQGYDSALKQNQALYQNILGGYNQVLAGQTSAQDAIGSGYTDLYNNVLQGLQGSQQSRAQEIADAYTKQSGAASQSLISRGLGNTTVQDAIQRGLSLDQQKAQTANANQYAGTIAGYQSNLGQARLGQQQLAASQQAAIAGQGLNWMNSVTARYPQAQDYYSIFQQSGQWDQANADRQAMQKLAEQQAASVPAVSAGVQSPRAQGGMMNRSTDPYGGALARVSSGGGYGSPMELSTGPNGVTGGPSSFQLNNPTPYAAQLGQANAAQFQQPYDLWGYNAHDAAAATPQYGGSNVYGGYEYSADPYAAPGAYGDIGGSFGGIDPSYIDFAGEYDPSQIDFGGDPWY